MYTMCVDACTHKCICACVCFHVCANIIFLMTEEDKIFLFVDNFCSQGTQDDLLVVHSSHSFIGQASCEGFGGPFQTHVDCAKPCTDKANITVTSNNFLNA